MKSKEINALVKACKTEAKEVLNGKWWKAIGVFLASTLIEFVIYMLANLIDVEIVQIILGIIRILIVVPLTFGLLKQLLRIKNGENVGYFDIYKSIIKDFGIAWKIQLMILVKLLPAILVTIIGGAIFVVLNEEVIGLIGGILLLVGIVLLIPKSIRYMFAYNEYLYNQDSIIITINKTEKKMEGKVEAIVTLAFSFILWQLLVVLITALLNIYVLPSFTFNKILYLVMNFIFTNLFTIILGVYMQTSTIIFYEKISNSEKAKETEENIQHI